MKSPTFRGSLASPVTRMVAVAIDLCLSYLLYSFLLSFDFFSNLYQHLFLFCIENLSLGAATLTSGLLIFLSYFLFRFYGTILFGVSLGQLLSGISSSVRGLRGRLHGVLRVLIECLTSPVFFLVELSLLFGRKTLKEKLSTTTLLYKGGKGRFFLGVVALILSLSLLYFAPLLSHLEQLALTKISEQKISAEDISSKTNFSSYKLIPSNTFSFASFSSLKNDEIVIVPKYEKIRRESIYSFRPEILFFDLKSKSTLTLKKEKAFSWNELLSEVKSQHPLFSFYYPSLSKFTKEKGNFKRDVFDGENRKKIFTSDLEAELEKLIRLSFELNFSNVHHHFLAHGPFLKSNFFLKNFFLKQVDQAHAVEVAIVEMGNYFFLNLSQNLTHHGTRVEHFFSLSSENAEHYVLTSTISEHSAAFLKTFKESFLGEIEFFSDYLQVFKLQDFLKDRKDLWAYDILLNEKIPLEERPVISREFTQFLETKLKSCEIDPELLKHCQEMLKDFYLAHQYFEEKYPDFWDENFLVFSQEAPVKKIIKKKPKLKKKRK